MSSSDIIRKAIDRLNERGVNNYHCSFCGNTEFVVHDKPATVMVTSDVNVIELKSYVPSVVFACKRCGHLDFFSLLQLDAIDKE